MEHEIQQLAKELYAKAVSPLANQVKEPAHIANEALELAKEFYKAVAAKQRRSHKKNKE